MKLSVCLMCVGMHVCGQVGQILTVSCPKHLVLSNYVHYHIICMYIILTWNINMHSLNRRGSQIQL